MAQLPPGNNVIPSIMINGAAKAIDQYVKGLGAKELYRMNAEGSDKIMHACLEIGNSKVFIADTNDMPNCSTPSNSSFYVYVEDADAAMKKAIQAGLKEMFPATDMFWGDRMGTVTDSVGNRWTLATHQRDVSPQEMEEGRKKFAAKKAA